MGLEAFMKLQYHNPFFFRAQLLARKHKKLPKPCSNITELALPMFLEADETNRWNFLRTGDCARAAWTEKSPGMHVTDLDRSGTGNGAN